MRITLTIYFLCLLFSNFANAQPGKLPLRYVQIPEETNAITKDVVFYEIFMKNNIMVFDKRKLNYLFYKNVASSKKNTINLPLEARNPFKSLLLGLHFQNNNKEDVYVYTYFPIKGSLGFVFGENDTISFGQMNLEKGTYLLNWISNDENGFYKKIENNINKEKIDFERKISDLGFQNLYENIKYYRSNSNIVGNADSLRFYESIYKDRKVIANKLEVTFNNSDMYCGYFKVKTKLTDTAHAFDLYGTWSPALHEGLNIKIEIMEKTMKEHKLSIEPISPEELERFYKNKLLDRPYAARKILAIFNESEN